MFGNNLTDRIMNTDYIAPEVFVCLIQPESIICLSGTESAAQTETYGDGEDIDNLF